MKSKEKDKKDKKSKKDKKDKKEKKKKAALVEAEAVQLDGDSKREEKKKRKRDDDEGKRGLCLVRDVAILALEGCPRSAPDPAGPVRAVVPLHARALLDRRYAPSIDDVVALAAPVLRHRMAVSFAGRAEGITVADVIEQMAAPFR